MIRLAPCLLLVLPILALAENRDPTALFPAGETPTDKRLTTVRSLDNRDFFLVPPSSLKAWKVRREEVRRRILVSMGLWPMPPKTPLKPVIHGKIIRDGYTIEKVYFASHPGHYVTGNLYRPLTKDGKRPQGKLPGVLCPHGHWANGRFYQATNDKIKSELKKKAETTEAGARYPLQARFAMLARMGCVVFHHDMVGYADSKTIPHSAFNTVDAELQQQNLMGLQTWNCIRALDFLLSLPDVDSKRIGVTGASGGGTQTFILGAIDDRPAVAFPAVMVSTRMQGGCVCENASYLRIGTGNVEFAALFAPKPLGLSGADDWTLEIERKGLPEMKKIWKLHDAEDRVMGKCYPQFDHNYNQVARELMYNWFNKHLNLGYKGTVKELPFKPVPPAELSVFDKSHPVPKDALSATKLREYLTGVNGKQLDALKPTDKKSALT